MYTRNDQIYQTTQKTKFISEQLASEQRKCVYFLSLKLLVWDATVFTSCTWGPGKAVMVINL